MHRSCRLMFLAAAVSASGAMAQPSAKPDAKPAAEPEAPLKGPSVATPTPKPTLVQRDFAGKVIRLDMQPAEAAAKLLTLDEAARAKVDAILLERSRILDQIVTDNLELLVKLQGARENPDKSVLAKLTKELGEKAAPLTQRGPLAAELKGVLPKEQGSELTRLIQEYWKAIVDEDTAKSASEREAEGLTGDGAESGTPATGRRDRQQAMRDEVLKMTGVEIKRAYERTIGARARDFDALIRELNLTPEQDAKVRQIVGDSFQKTYGKATPQERSRVFWEVYQALDSTQQQALLAKLAPRHKPVAPADTGK